MKSYFIKLCVVVVLFASFANHVYSRPISYPGGFTIMQMNDADKNTLHLHYSPTAKYSIGYRAEYWRDNDWLLHSAQLNYLVNRWNKPSSQANLYFKSGLGVIDNSNNPLGESDQNTGFYGLAFDWEDRRYFASYENRYYQTESGAIDDFYMHSARVGIAPYIGKYNDLHTWIMLQLDHHSEKQDELVITPLLRFFKNQYLAEIGINQDGEGLFNLIIRF